MAHVIHIGNSGQLASDQTPKWAFNGALVVREQYLFKIFPNSEGNPTVSPKLCFF